MRHLYKNFVFDLVIAISALVLGIAMLPPFGIGIYALNILLAATLVVYFLVYLWDKLARSKGAIFMLTVLECFVYLLVIVNLILHQFKIINTISVCRALGIVLWTRGTISAIGMYIKALSSKHRRSHLPDFLFRLFMISVGMLFIAHPLLTDTILNWAMCILFYLSALAFGGLAILFSPIKQHKIDETIE